MSYSCTDFTDDILNTLGIEVPDEDQDNPEAQAELAIAEIIRLQALDVRKPDDLTGSINHMPDRNSDKERID